MLAPASIPVAAGKKMANTEKKLLSSLNDGPKLAVNTSSVIGEMEPFYISVPMIHRNNTSCLCIMQ